MCRFMGHGRAVVVEVRHTQRGVTENHQETKLKENGLKNTYTCFTVIVLIFRGKSSLLHLWPLKKMSVHLPPAEGSSSPQTGAGFLGVSS